MKGERASTWLGLSSRALGVRPLNERITALASPSVAAETHSVQPLFGLVANLDRFRQSMWEPVAKEMGMPWRAVESKHWELGAGNMAERAGVPMFLTHHSAQVQASWPSIPLSGQSLGSDFTMPRQPVSPLPRASAAPNPAHQYAQYSYDPTPRPSFSAAPAATSQIRPLYSPPGSTSKWYSQQNWQDNATLPPPNWPWLPGLGRRLSRPVEMDTFNPPAERISSHRWTCGGQGRSMSVDVQALEPRHACSRLDEGRLRLPSLRHLMRDDEQGPRPVSPPGSGRPATAGYWHVSPRQSDLQPPRGLPRPATPHTDATHRPEPGS